MATIKMKPSGLRKVKPTIVKCIASQSCDVFRPSQLSHILSTLIYDRKIGGGVTNKEFILFLSSEGLIRKIKLEFPGKTFTRYILENASVFEIALSIFPRSYLSHYSAVFVHHLTDQIPKTVYVNHEQKLKSISVGELQQSRIDMAFKNAQRLSNYRTSFQEHDIVALNGKNTGNLGVIEASGPQNEPLHVTTVERTLIDIAVRPVYAGGVFEVLNAYKTAADHLSVNKLTATLKQLEHTYPYHQAIGFYLEKAGTYSDVQMNLLRKAFPMDFDFYLVHGMKETSYSERWRLHYPKGM
jgi:predicted transcriptional regulator of viral defense system